MSSVLEGHELPKTQEELDRFVEILNVLSDMQKRDSTALFNTFLYNDLDLKKLL